MAEVPQFSGLPSEIQLLIFEQFDRLTLHATVRVNKKWCNMSADLLWKVPSISRITKLASLPSLKRRRYYARKIEILKIRELSITPAFNKLVFSSLKVLWLNGGANTLRRAVHLDPYLGPRIRILALRGCELHSHSLNLIPSRCPELTRLEICGPLFRVDDFAFAFFIKSLSCLRQLCLCDMFTVSAATAMFRSNAETLAPEIERLDLLNLLDFPDPEPFRMFMMSCGKLQYLSILSCQRNWSPKLMTGSVLAHVLKTNPLQHLAGDWLSPGLLEQMPVSPGPVRSFGQLNTLRKSGCSSSALTILLQASSHLQHLELNLCDVTAQLFSFIGSQVQLRHLAITSRTDEVLSITHLLALSSLTSLVHLEIAYRRRNAIFPVVHGLNDRLFSRLVSGFSQLRTLVLNLDYQNLGVDSIKSLSKACPLLQRCALLYDHDLSTWSTAQAASDLHFPNLVSLYLGGVLDLSHDTMPSISEDDRKLPGWLNGEFSGLRLLSYLPRLERFGVERYSGTAVVVQNVLVKAGPCRPTNKVPITVVQGSFSHDKFMRFP